MTRRARWLIRSDSHRMEEQKDTDLSAVPRLGDRHTRFPRRNHVMKGDNCIFFVGRDHTGSDRVQAREGKTSDPPSTKGRKEGRERNLLNGGAAGAVGLAEALHDG